MHPALRALRGRWLAHCGPRALPSEDDLAFLNLKPWLGRVWRVRVIDGGRAFEVRSCVHAPGTPDSERLAIAFRRAVAAEIPVAVPIGGNEALILPFAGADHGVALLLVAVYEAPPPVLLTEYPYESRRQKR